MSSDLSVEDQIQQLNQAKAVVAQNAVHYADIVNGILPIAQKPNTSLRRWCSSFFIDAFNSFSLSQEKKQSMAINCLETISILLNDNDYEVQKNTVTVAATVFGLIFQLVAKDDTQTRAWEQIISIKSRVLEIWDSSHFGVEAESIKFAQQVIIYQSPLHRDPRLASSNDAFSLSSVPSNHRLIQSSLEAEAQGLLDRLLGVFLESTVSAKSITATIYALISLMKLRPATISKCMNAVFAFDPSQKAINGKTGAEIDIEYKVIQKALVVFMKHIKNANMAPNYNSKIQEYTAMLAKPRDKNIERRQPKHQPVYNEPQVQAPAFPPNSSTSVPTGPYSYASLYSLLDANNPLLEFDAQTLPLDMAVNIALAGIAASNPELLKNCVDIVKAKYDNFLQQSRSQQLGGSSVQQGAGAAASNNYSHANGNSDGSDYDPNEDSGLQVATTGDAMEDDYGYDDELDGLELGTSFSLPAPAKLSEEERLKAIKTITSRLISYDKINTTLQALPSGAANANKGIDRVAVTEWTKNTWVILTSRLLTRGVGASARNLNEEDAKVVTEMADSIRDSLFNYAMENFRERLDIIIEWLNEEWFGEFVQKSKKRKAITQDVDNGEATEETMSMPDSPYFKYTAMVLDNITPFLAKSDRPQFLRLLSDLPELNRSLIQRLKSLCIDPERRELGMSSLL